MRDATLRPGAEDVEEASLAACIASLLDLETRDVPPGAAAQRPWLAQRALGLAPLADAAGFQWPGPWIGHVRAPDGRAGSVVRFGVPSGTIHDPAGLGPDAVLDGGWVLAAFDPIDGRRDLTRATRLSTAGVVEELCLAPTREGPVQSVSAATAIACVGLEGDRYALGAGTFPSPGDGAALTLIDADVLASFTPPLRAAEHRRNVVTRGIDLDGLIGRRFRIGTVLCEGRRAAEPCAHLQRLADRALLRPLVHRAGIRADILEGGLLRTGDEVVPVRVR